MLNAIGGWKTKLGIAAVVIGGGLLAGAEVSPMPELTPWLKFIGTMLVAIGTGGGIYGVAHKVEKSKGGTPIVGLSFIAMFGALAILAAGCASDPSKYTSQAYSNSWILTVCEKQGWNAEEIADYLVDLSILGIGAGVYDRQDAARFIADFRGIVETPLSYRYLLTWLSKYQAELADREGALALSGLVILSRHAGAFDSTQIISADDRKILGDLANYWQSELDLYIPAR